MAQYLSVDVTVARLCWALSIFRVRTLGPAGLSRGLGHHTP
ncbi:MAG: hypothetical protein QME70_02600 [Bacillota bacterium]|nr:hypothetical protein [Bacillota bacterium]